MVSRLSTIYDKINLKATEDGLSASSMDIKNGGRSFWYARYAEGLGYVEHGTWKGAECKGSACHYRSRDVAEEAKKGANTNSEGQCARKGQTNMNFYY